MNKLIKKYIDAGVHQSKIVVTVYPSICTWSLSRKCLINENGVSPLEVIDDGYGNKKLTYENNQIVSMEVRTELDSNEVNTINNSAGIIITEYEHFRFGFIPT